MRIRSLRNRLALIFGLIVLGAIAIVYFAVAPQLEGRLRDQKLDGLADDAKRYAPPLRRLVGSDAPQSQVAREVRLVATRASAEVNVVGVVGGTEDSLFVIADSDTGGVEIDDVQSVAQAALATGRTARATEPTRLGRQALVAEPLVVGDQVRGVAVFADALTDVQANVSLIRRQILYAGAFAFLIAVLGRLPRRARPVAARQAPGARRAQGRAPATSPTASSRTPTTSSASSAPRSTTCSASSSAWTARASSSSRRPRTSCARRCSRSAASSSCSRTRSSTRRRGASSSTTCARRWRG